VSDKLSAQGLSVFEKSKEIQVDVKTGLKKDELLAIIGDYDALAIRSATKVDKDVLERGTKLKVIGRAGIGVDNVDVPEASRRGIIVMNTPDGNVITTAEHAISMMAALTRRIPQATASMKAGQWEKSKFEGRELYNKVLGVVGLGKIGKIVASRAQGLKMRVIAFDPFLSQEQAQELGVELVSKDELLTRSDYVTLHVPLLDSTKMLLDRAALDRMKKGAFLINCARGGLVDEAAVAEAVKSGKLGGAAFDVFAQEPPPADHPLLSVDNVILTPHLGASTSEAQENVALSVAEQIVAFLETGAVMNAVNAPSVSAEAMAQVGPWVDLAKKLGSLAKIQMRYRGRISDGSLEPLTIAILTGVLSVRVENVNEVNAPLVAEERGIECVEEKTATARDFAALVAVRVEGDEGATEVEGTLVGAKEPLVVRVNGVRLEIVPDGHLLLTQHHDKPGMVGKIGTILGQHQINISRMTLAESESGKPAQAAISVDAAIPEPVLKELRAITGVVEARSLLF
jgi:D-3-phosphoglycerate dehydrogenase